MPSYGYIARDKNGSEAKGRMEAGDEETLIKLLHLKGLTVITLSEKGIATTGKRSFGPIFSPLFGGFGIKIKTEALLIFVEQLSVMVSAGIPLLRILKSLSQDTSNKKFKGILERLSSDVSMGSSFSGALAKFPTVFSQLFVDLAKAGEATGKLELTMNQLADYMVSRANIGGKIRSALVYPIIITVFSLMVVMVLALWIIPKFKGIYEGMGADLPIPTKILLATSDVMQTYFVVGLCLAGLGGVAGLLFLNTLQGRRIFDKFKLLLPTVGIMLKKNSLSIFCRTMGILLSSGITVIQAIEMSCRSVDNKIIEEALLRTAERIEKGMSIVDSFRQEKIFPVMLIQMIASGEETGNLENTIVKVSDFYDRQLNAFATAFTALIEPVLLFIIGSMVGGMVIALFLPMFKMGAVLH